MPMPTYALDEQSPEEKRRRERDEDTLKLAVKEAERSVEAAKERLKQFQTNESRKLAQQEEQARRESEREAERVAARKRLVALSEGDGPEAVEAAKILLHN